MANADLSLTNVLSNTAPNAGDPFTYTVTVTNNGPDETTGVTVQDTLQPNQRLVSYTTGDTMLFDPATGQWNIGLLQAGDSATLVLHVVAVSGTFGNGATISHLDETDPDTSNNSAFAGVHVNDPPVLRGLGVTGSVATLKVGEAQANAGGLQIDSDVVFTDADFAGGSLVVSGLLAEDRVGLLTDGTVGVSGATVSVSGTPVGTIAGGTGTTFTITINSSANAAAVDTLIQHLTYQDVSTTPTLNRTLSIVVTDETGANTDHLLPHYPIVFGGLGDQPNPYAGVTVDAGRPLSFADLNGDGRVDLVAGANDGTLRTYFRNPDGSFTEQTGVANPFNGIDVGTNSAPVLGDLDRDGAIDLVVGAGDGTVHAYFNVGGTFVDADASNPFAAIALGTNAAPALADLNFDGLLDLAVGLGDGKLHAYFQNGDGSFTEQTGAANPFNGIDVGNNSKPALGDLNGDGHLYLAVGDQSSGQLHTYLQNPLGAFVPLTGSANPFNFGISSNAAPAFVDINGDGDLDLAGPLTGQVFSVSNIPQLPQATITVVGQNSLPVLTGLTASFGVAENASNAAPAVIDSDVTFTDADLHGGSIVVSGLLAEDRVGLLSDATVSLSGATVSVGGTAVGTASGGTGSTFTIALNASTTAAAVETLIEHLTYQDVSDTPTASRTLSIVVTDDTGAATNQSLIPTVEDSPNPFAGIAIGSALPVTFGDLNGDGHADLVTGVDDGTIHTYFRNADGSYTQQSGAASPFNGIDVGNYSAPALIDVNSDGKLDLVVGTGVGTLVTYLNSGSTFALAGTNPFNGVDVGDFSTPTAIDLDGDGRSDVVVGSQFGNLHAYHQNADGSFTELTGANNPFNAISTFASGGYSTPTFGDVNGDGRLDLLVGNLNGSIDTYLRNPDGSFSAAASNPFAGIIVFASSPTLADFNGDGNLDLVVGDANGVLHSYVNNKQIHDITVTVTAENDAPVITSNGGGDAASLALPENNTSVTTVTATDPNAGGTLTYSIVGGADAALFHIDAASGALVFNTAPNFEAPADSDGNNSYLVQVRAADGSLFDDQAITVNVTDVSEAPGAPGGPAAATVTILRPTDFNADGTDDLLFRNGDGSVSVFVSSNGHVNPPAAPAGSAPLSTDIEGTGDFNGDGRGDILFRSADGHITEWLMNGGQIQAITDIGSTSAGFQVAGTGDFNGDRTDDILFRGDNGDVVTWSMQSGHLASIQTAGTTDAASHIQGTGDFNGDGRTDILFRNEAGQVSTWLMNANGQAGAIVPVGNAPASTHIAATGDVNGDGVTDILFRNDDGHVTAWLMNAGHIASIVENVGSADASWQIQGAGDVNGNGTDDILWRNDDGHVVDWMMNGGHLTTIQDLGHTPVPTHIGGSQFDLL